MITVITIEEMMENKIIGPIIRESQKIGEEKGIKKGIEQGLGTGRTMLTRLLNQRFGSIPAGVALRIQSATATELEPATDRLLTAASITDVFAGLN